MNGAPVMLPVQNSELKMEKEKDELRPVTGRARQARRTWFWAHLFFGVLFVAVAALIYEKTGRTGLALIFGVAGLIELVNVLVNPIKIGKR